MLVRPQNDSDASHPLALGDVFNLPEFWVSHAVMQVGVVKVTRSGVCGRESHVNKGSESMHPGGGPGNL